MERIQHFKRRATWTVQFLVRQSHKILNDFIFFIGCMADRLVFLGNSRNILELELNPTLKYLSIKTIYLQLNNLPSVNQFTHILQ